MQEKIIKSDYLTNSPLGGRLSKHIDDFNDEIGKDITPASTYEEMESSIHKSEHFTV